MRARGFIAGATVTVTLAAALLGSSVAVATTASNRVVRTGQTTRAYNVGATNARGYRWGISVTLRGTPRVLTRPGYNVGDYDVSFDPSWITLRVTDKTSGRTAEVLPPCAFIGC